MASRVIGKIGRMVSEGLRRVRFAQEAFQALMFQQNRNRDVPQKEKHALLIPTDAAHLGG